MRVIAGSARRLLLKTPKGMDTRPTQDRIKETLFNMLQQDIYGARFLDIFAGSGGIGIEALSRGADYAVFIDHGRESISCIKDNLKTTHLESKARVVFGDVLSSIASLKESLKEAPFDIVFMDPPYASHFEAQVLKALLSSKLVNESTIVIIEASLDREPDFLAEAGFSLVKEKLYKTNKHIFAELEIV